MIETKVDPICVIGMHRSGTSMVTRVLNACGLYLGPQDQLLNGYSSNPDGHFEHLGFLQINNNLLKNFGGSWDHPPRLTQGWQNADMMKGPRAQAVSLVASFVGKGHWGWKDPRTTVLVPFWKTITENLRFVICLRSPLDVAMSLQTRNGMTLTQGSYLWNRYMRSAIQDTRGSPRIFTFYDDYFDDTLAEIRRVTEFCGLEMPNERVACREMVSRNLRHQTSDISDLVTANSIPTEHKMLYLGLRALSSHTRAAPNHNCVDEARISESVDELLQLIEKSTPRGPVARLQSMLLENVYRIRTRIQKFWRRKINRRIRRKNLS